MPSSCGGRSCGVNGIDDDTAVRDHMRHVLSSAGFHPFFAASGAEGINLAEQVSPDVIVVDVMMPEMDGWAVLKTLKPSVEIGPVPVIVMSAVDNGALAQALGANAFIMKPISQDRMLDEIRKGCRYTHQLRQRAAVSLDSSVTVTT